MRILRCLAIIVLVVPATARADDHRADINAAFSYANASNLLGLHLTVAKPLSGRERWSVLGDFSFHTDIDDDVSEKRLTYLTGGRYTAPVPGHGRHKLFAQALFGLGQAKLNGDDDEDFASAFGGGWEFLWGEPETPGVKNAKAAVDGIRVQVDYVIAQGDTKNFPRLSVGWVHRWEKK